MKKIPTLFKRVFTEDHQKTITREVTPGCECVLRGECVATVKWDGACCAIINGEIYKRYDAKLGKDGKRKTPPEGAIPCQSEPDPITGHWPHWVKCIEGNPADKYFLEAFENYKRDGDWTHIYPALNAQPTGEGRIGTYEAIGPSWQNNPYDLRSNTLKRHGNDVIFGSPDDICGYTPSEAFATCRDYLRDHDIEGIVFWCDGKPVCKIKRSDFGFEWPPKKSDPV